MDLETRIQRRLQIEGNVDHEDVIDFNQAASIAALEAEDSTTDGQNILDAEAYARGTHPLVLAEPDLNALHAAGLKLPDEADVQRPDARAGGPVVVGGRYVVGENPTFQGLSGPVYLAGWAGKVVTMTGGPDKDGDVLVDDSLWISSRHLSPAPEPAAAPAVDDELLRDLVNELEWGTDEDAVEGARIFLSSEPMQRLRAAWTGTTTFQLQNALSALRDAERDRDEARRRIDLMLGGGKREAEALRAALPSWKGPNGTHLGPQIEWLARERDEARAEIRRMDRIAGNLQADLERLRAAQPQLPEVGPVTRDKRGQLHCGSSLSSVGTSAQELRTTVQEVLKMAAELTAIADRVDAEAGSTSSDDEVEELARVLHANDDAEDSWGDEPGWSQEVYRRQARAVIAHRARGGQEAGQ